MGNWAVVIRGVGCHHNGRRGDVEQIAARTVNELKAEGHNVIAATVTTGFETDVLDRQHELLPIDK